MPTLLTHPAVPLALGLGLGRTRIPRPLLTAGVAASLLPDLDVIAFRLGVPYAAPFGHRGFSHSLLVASLLALAGAWALQRRVPPSTSLWFLFVAVASHGLLDTLTTGGLGIALFWPWSDARIFAPVQLVRVSPFGVKRLLSERGLAVLTSELIWVWLPALALGGVLRWWTTVAGESRPRAARLEP
jgi:inner membrane protein